VVVVFFVVLTAVFFVDLGFEAVLDFITFFAAVCSFLLAIYAPEKLILKPNINEKR
jgi:hypothetical protein